MAGPGNGVAEKFVNVVTNAAITLAQALGSVFGASGAGHSVGLVPDPGSSAGTTRFLREDGTWAAAAQGSFVPIAGGVNMTGGVTWQPFQIPTPSSGGSVTPDPLNGLKQYIENNNGGFTINPPTDIGDVELTIHNLPGAGAIAFSNTFSKQFTSDATDTTNGHNFIAYIYTAPGPGGSGVLSMYTVKALQ